METQLSSKDVDPSLSRCSATLPQALASLCQAPDLTSDVLVAELDRTGASTNLGVDAKCYVMSALLALWVDEAAFMTVFDRDVFLDRLVKVLIYSDLTSESCSGDFVSGLVGVGINISLAACRPDRKEWMLLCREVGKRVHLASLDSKACAESLGIFVRAQHSSCVTALSATQLDYPMQLVSCLLAGDAGTRMRRLHAFELARAVSDVVPDATYDQLVIDILAHSVDVKAIPDYVVTKSVSSSLSVLVDEAVDRSDVDTAPLMRVVWVLLKCLALHAHTLRDGQVCYVGALLQQCTRAVAGRPQESDCLHRATLQGLCFVAALRQSKYPNKHASLVSDLVRVIRIKPGWEASAHELLAELVKSSKERFYTVVAHLKICAELIGASQYKDATSYGKLDSITAAWQLRLATPLLESVQNPADHTQLLMGCGLGGAAGRTGSFKALEDSTLPLEGVIAVAHALLSNQIFEKSQVFKLMGSVVERFRASELVKFEDVDAMLQLMKLARMKSATFSWDICLEDIFTHAVKATWLPPFSFEVGEKYLQFAQSRSAAIHEAWEGLKDQSIVKFPNLHPSRKWIAGMKERILRVSGELELQTVDTARIQGLLARRYLYVTQLVYLCSHIKWSHRSLAELNAAYAPVVAVLQGDPHGGVHLELRDDLVYVIDDKKDAVGIPLFAAR